jgi:hypothetical protein
MIWEARYGITFSTKILVEEEILDVIKSTSWRLFLATSGCTTGGFRIIFSSIIHSLGDFSLAGIVPLVLIPNL